ncbi:GNAT family N-acetyltransferase [Bacillus carboniphilus]|uniref:GNAT family N-acetyltransferase n=1 Tax=Bacillus carboniphilus TaxID=86663 RepID=A0ABP3GH28_9BACI
MKSLQKTITYKIIEDLEEINMVVELQAEIWSPDIVSPLPQLVAAIHNGGVVIGAFTDEKLVGFSYGFAGFKDGEAYLISHMTGILPDYQNAGIGYQLKTKQREWAIQYGFKKMIWTFDPLELRNAYFNVCKLGGYSRQYIRSYYGELNDKLNKGLPSDRLLVEWDICSKRVEEAMSGALQTESEYEILYSWEQVDGYTTPTHYQNRVRQNHAGYRVPVPSNIQVIKQQKPDAALAWRHATRTAIEDAFSNGYLITGVQREQGSSIHFYILESH